jgi:hypothetical protein
MAFFPSGVAEPLMPPRPSTIVADIKSQIEAFYQTIPTFASSTLQAEADAIVTMPDQSGFPIY